MILFGKWSINNKKWMQQLGTWSLYYRTEIVYASAGLIVGFIIGVMI